MSAGNVLLSIRLVRLGWSKVRESPLKGVSQLIKKLLTMLVILTGSVGSAGAVWAKSLLNLN